MRSDLVGGPFSLVRFSELCCWNLNGYEVLTASYLSTVSVDRLTTRRAPHLSSFPQAEGKNPFLLSSPANLLRPPFLPHSSPGASLLHHALHHLHGSPFNLGLEEEEKETRIGGEQESFPNFPLHQIFVI